MTNVPTHPAYAVPTTNGVVRTTVSTAPEPPPPPQPTAAQLAWALVRVTLAVPLYAVGWLFGAAAACLVNGALAGWRDTRSFTGGE